MKDPETSSEKTAAAKAQDRRTDKGVIRQP